VCTFLFQEKSKRPKEDVGQDTRARPLRVKEALIDVARARGVTATTDVSHQQVPVVPGTTSSTTTTAAVEPTPSTSRQAASVLESPASKTKRALELEVEPVRPQVLFLKMNTEEAVKNFAKHK
jgi:hypothetical protein